MPPSVLHLPALILHRSAWSESSWILRCLVADKGILSISAKGGRRQNSPFAGRLEPLSFVEIGFSHREHRDVQTLTEISVLERFPQVWGNLHAQALTLSWVELVLALQIHGSHANEALLDLLKALRFIEADPDKALAREGLLSLRFLSKLANYEGFALQIDSCQNCGIEINAHNVAQLQNSEGGFICEQCSNFHPDPASQALWLALCEKPTQSALWPRAETLLLDYLCCHAPHTPRLRAREVLLELRSNSSKETPLA